MTHIVFFCEKHYGGYGDRLVGMASAITIARTLGATFSFSWEPEFMALCTPQPERIPSKHLNMINKRSSDILEKEPLKDTWANTVIYISANIPIDILMWKNPAFHLGSYDSEAIRSFREIMPALGLQPVSMKYEVGVQIRCGDTYCMPHSLAEQYIPEEAWPAFAAKIKAYIEGRGIRGAVYLTSDTYKIYPHFLALNDEIQFTVIDRKDDIHFDFHNSHNRYKEIVDDHLELQSCQRIITGLRSNFGTTAAYSSPICQEMIVYSPDLLSFKEYDTGRQLILKEYQVSV